MRCKKLKYDSWASLSWCFVDIHCTRVSQRTTFSPGSRYSWWHAAQIQLHEEPRCPAISRQLAAVRSVRIGLSWRGRRRTSYPSSTCRLSEAGRGISACCQTPITGMSALESLPEARCPHCSFPSSLAQCCFLLFLLQGLFLTKHFYPKLSFSICFQRTCPEQLPSTVILNRLHPSSDNSLPPSGSQASLRPERYVSNITFALENTKF